MTGASSSVAGLTVNVGGSTVLGYSLSGVILEAGTGTLVSLTFDPSVSSSTISLADIVISSWDATAIESSAGTAEVPGCSTDCAGVCYGDAEEDECGTCDSDSGNDCIQDCAGEWGGLAVVDDCDVCGGGNADQDECGVCYGGNADDLGCGCFEAGPSGCDNTCGSDLVDDACGVCGGDGSDDVGCGCFEAGPSGCDNTCGSDLVDDACGVCGGDGSDDVGCGCFEAGPSGCDNACGSDLVDDACGVCGGDGSDDVGCGCFEAGPSGCDNTCGSDLVDDACGACGGDGSDDLGCGCFEAGPSGCDNACGSTLADDECGVCDGDGSTCTASISLGSFDSSGSLEIFYNFGSVSTGFQFDVTGLALTGAAGEAAGDAGFTVSTGSNGTVLGFSFSGATIPAGSGVLTVLSFSDVTAGTTELSLNMGAITDANGDPFVNQSASGSIDHGEPDCAGVFYGDSSLDDCGVCDGGNADNLGCGCFEAGPSGCDNACGSTLEFDDCGVCNGPGPDEGFDCDGSCINSGICGSAALSFSNVTDSGADVLYDASVDIGGFQFVVEGVLLTGASSSVAGLTVNVGGSTVLGYSLSGVILEAGTGTLVSLTFDPSVSSSTISLADIVISSWDATAIESSAGTAEVPGCSTDCAGVCYGDAEEDECGTCDSDSGNDCIQDCAGEWGGLAVVDDCDVCGGGNADQDECGVCYGGNADDLGCGCFEAGPSGCDNTCGSDLVDDACGVCGGDGSDDVGCGCFEAGPSGCDNTCGSDLVDDACGVCGGDGSDDVGCGCFEAGPSGCDNTCGSDLVDDACGVCGGDGSDDVGCGCFEAGPSGCDNTCGSDLVDDACGVCGGDGSDDVGCGCFEAGPSGCDNACGSTLADDECGVCDGDGSTCTASISLGSFDSSGSLEIFYNFGSVSTGFQFDVTGLALTGGSGEAAGDAGFTVSTGSNGTVLGFSFSGATIPAGSGVLTVLSFSDVTAGTTELSLNMGAITDANGDPFVNQSASGSIDHGEPDCAGVFYGDAVVDDCDVCGGGNADMDDCGVCNGPGPDEGFDCDGSCINSGICGSAALSFSNVTDSGADVLYDASVDIGGFQFVVEGVSLTGASSSVAGLTVNVGGSTVLGYSLSGVILEAGTGTLVSLTFDPSVSSSTISLADIVISSWDATEIESSAGTAEVPGCSTDCAGVCYGDAEEDECGTCDSDSGNDCIQDCAGEWGGLAVVDDCDVCGGGNADQDECGVCYGGNADDLGCGCFEAGPSGCDNTCGSTLEDD